jgi:hypothetical protein
MEELVMRELTLFAAVALAVFYPADASHPSRACTRAGRMTMAYDDAELPNDDCDVTNKASMTTYTNGRRSGAKNFTTLIVP